MRLYMHHSTVEGYTTWTENQRCELRLGDHETPSCATVRWARVASPTKGHAQQGSWPHSYNLHGRSLLRHVGCSATLMEGSWVSYPNPVSARWTNRCACSLFTARAGTQNLLARSARCSPHADCFRPKVSGAGASSISNSCPPARASSECQATRGPLGRPTWPLRINAGNPSFGRSWPGPVEILSKRLLEGNVSVWPVPQPQQLRTTGIAAVPLTLSYRLRASTRS